MKIGIDARFVSNGSGLGRYAYKLIEHVLKLDKKNYYYLIVYRDEGKILDFKYGNYEIREVDFKHYSFGEQMGFLQYINRLNCDLVHFANFNHPIWYRKKFVVTIHDLTLLFFPGRVRRKWIAEWGYKMVMNSAVRNSRKVIAITEFTKRDILKYLNADENKVRVIYEAADERIKKEENTKLIDKIKGKYHITKPYFLYVGQWRVHKNLVRLIEAFDILKSKDIDAQLLLVGKEDPRYPEVKQKINGSMNKDDVIVTGYVPDADMSALYSGSIAFVFPTLYEGIGLPPLEAMNCGLPVISSDASCMPEVLQDAVLYFDPYDPKEIAAAMEKVASDEKLRFDLIKRGYNQVNKYSWKKMAEETLRLYEEVLREG